MIDFVRENMAPLMFGGLIVFMLIGYPAAFSLAAVGLFFAFSGIQLGLIEPNFLGNLTYQLFGIVSNDQGTLLLAIPFFTFMGAILERCGLAEDLLDSHRPAFRPGTRWTLLRGDLRRRYPWRHHRDGRRFRHRDGCDRAAGHAPIRLFNAAHGMGVIAASGTITQLIPPSLVLIILADQLGRSVGDMYAGAIGPSHHSNRLVLHMGVDRKYLAA